MVNIKFVQAKLHELWVNRTYFSAHLRIFNYDRPEEDLRYFQKVNNIYLRFYIKQEGK